MPRPEKNYSKYHVYKPVYDEITDWPIYKHSEDREQFVKDLNEFTLARIMSRRNNDIEELLSKTIYQEKIRVKEEPWKVDPPNERQFWNKMRKRLINRSLDKEQDEARASNEEILKRIIHRYSEEIVATFKIKTFLFARKFLTFFFGRLLNSAAHRNFKRIYGGGYNLHDTLEVTGQVDLVRTLMRKGTVVLVPTHFSNLDSIMIGYAMDSIAGIPMFSFGAGLNLYNTGYTAYYMNRLGAYRIDRRKKNPVYLETLKAMSNLSIQRGLNSLFFPGGTRSRSGSMETKLKMGMLGTTIEAQRANLQNGKDEKVFIVPLVLGYHFVLEAEFLIENYLKKTGKERYLKTKDQSYSPRKLFSFLWEIFSESSDVVLSLGKPMDVLGNFVDEEGRSFDQHGNELDLQEYFMVDGEIKKDFQRESEYTRILAGKIVDRFYKDNIVLTSHLVAYAAFRVLMQSYKDLDIYGLLRQPPEDFIFDKELFTNVLEQLKERLFDMQEQGLVKLSDEISWVTPKIIEDGIKRVGSYHDKKPLKIDKDGNIISENFHVLFFYHNRLENYKLHEHINWKVTQVMAVLDDLDKIKTFY